MMVSETLRTVTWQAALLACRAVVDHAAGQGWQVNVAVTDRSGTLVGFLRMPRSFPQSAQIAIEKARTAAGFGFPTSQWMAACADNEGMKLGFSNQPGLIVFGGGLPLVDGGQVIGGIGVSGASETQDEQCARIGLQALEAASTQEQQPPKQRPFE